MSEPKEKFTCCDYLSIFRFGYLITADGLCKVLMIIAGFITVGTIHNYDSTAQKFLLFMAFLTASVSFVLFIYFFREEVKDNAGKFNKIQFIFYLLVGVFYLAGDLWVVIEFPHQNDLYLPTAFSFVAVLVCFVNSGIHYKEYSAKQKNPITTSESNAGSIE